MPSPGVKALSSWCPSGLSSWGQMKAIVFHKHVPTPTISSNLHFLFQDQAMSCCGVHGQGFATVALSGDGGGETVAKIICARTSLWWSYVFRAALRDRGPLRFTVVCQAWHSFYRQFWDCPQNHPALVNRRGPMCGAKVCACPPSWAQRESTIVP